MRAAKQHEIALFDAIKKMDLQEVRILLKIDPPPKKRKIKDISLGIYLEIKSECHYSSGYVTPVTVALDVAIQHPHNEDAMSIINLMRDKKGPLASFNIKKGPLASFNIMKRAFFNGINAIYHGRADLLKILFDRMYQVEWWVMPELDSEFMNAMKFAVKQNHLEAVKIVIEARIYNRVYHLRTSETNVLLEIAVNCNHLEMTRLLLINSLDNYSADLLSLIQGDGVEAEKMRNLLLTFTQFDLFNTPRKELSINKEKAFFIFRDLPVLKKYALFSGKDDPSPAIESFLNFFHPGIPQIILEYLNHFDSIFIDLFMHGDNLVNKFKVSSKRYPDSLKTFASYKLHYGLFPLAQEMRIRHEVEKLIERGYQFEEDKVTSRKISQVLGEGAIENITQEIHQRECPSYRIFPALPGVYDDISNEVQIQLQTLKNDLYVEVFRTVNFLLLPESKTYIRELKEMDSLETLNAWLQLHHKTIMNELNDFILRSTMPSHVKNRAYHSLLMLEKLTKWLNESLKKEIFLENYFAEPIKADSIRKKLETFSQLPNFITFLHNKDGHQALLQNIQKVNNTRDAVNWCQDILMFLNQTYKDDKSVKESVPFITLIQQLTVLMSNYVKIFQTISQQGQSSLEYKSSNFC